MAVRAWHGTADLTRRRSAIARLCELICRAMLLTEGGSSRALPPDVVIVTD
jgi:hypothetical protein